MSERGWKPSTCRWEEDSHPQKRWDSVLAVWVILGLGLGCVKFNISIKHSKIKEAVGNESGGAGERTGLEIQIQELTAFRWYAKQ